jgi:hypothetical protein
LQPIGFVALRVNYLIIPEALAFALKAESECARRTIANTVLADGTGFFFVWISAQGKV